MPVSFLTESERERLQKIPKEIPSEDITAFFMLTDTDFVFVSAQHGNHNKVGVALQLCLLRYLGFCPQDITTIPEQALSYIASQLTITSVDLGQYGRRTPTRTEHFQAIQAHLGFRKASAEDVRAISRWLMERALEHDKPSLLFRLLCEKLYAEKIVRPGITRLEKLVGTARAQAQEETYRRVAHLLTAERCVFLDSLLVADAVTNRTRHSWLGKGATSNTAFAMLFCLDKLAFLRSCGVPQWDLSAL